MTVRAGLVSEFATAAVGRGQVKTMDGGDVFLRDRTALVAKITEAADGAWLTLQMTTKRRVKIWPDGLPETGCTDHGQARCQSPELGSTCCSYPLDLLHRLDRAGLDFVKTEDLYRFDHELGYSLRQDQ